MKNTREPVIVTVSTIYPLTASLPSANLKLELQRIFGREFGVVTDVSLLSCSFEHKQIPIERQPPYSLVVAGPLQAVVFDRLDRNRLVAAYASEKDWDPFLLDGLEQYCRWRGALGLVTESRNVWQPEQFPLFYAADKSQAPNSKGMRGRIAPELVRYLIGDLQRDAEHAPLIVRGDAPTAMQSPSNAHADF